MRFLLCFWSNYFHSLRNQAVHWQSHAPCACFESFLHGRSFVVYASVNGLEKNRLECVYPLGIVLAQIWAIRFGLHSPTKERIHILGHFTLARLRAQLRHKESGLNPTLSHQISYDIPDSTVSELVTRFLPGQYWSELFHAEIIQKAQQCLPE